MPEISAESDQRLALAAVSEVSPPDLHEPSPKLASVAGPVDAQHRISALDSLRGFALLGILPINIIAMGMYGTAYDNPTVAGGSTGPNLWVWIMMHILAEGKMRCLFSMVFGASVILLTSRLHGRADAADIYYRRTLWLLLFGIMHAYLFWEGDILYPYALCGLALYPFRNLNARRLLIIGGSLLVINIVLHIGHGLKQRNMIGNAMAAERAVKQGKLLTAEQEAVKDEYEQWNREVKPSAEALKKDAETWQSRNPLRVIRARVKIVLPSFHNVPYYSPGHLDIWCMMFLGMGLLKLRVLTAQRSIRFYAILTLIGYGIGLPLNSYTAWLIVKSHFDPSIQAFTGVAYDLGRLTVALGHLAVIMLFTKMGTLRWLMHSLAAVGQMALSNYIFQSVLTSFIFTGYGLALYGKLQRYQLYYIVVVIWIFQLIVSPIWMRHYQFGPLEWCWRSLTYWGKQRMRRVALV